MVISLALMKTAVACGEPPPLWCAKECGDRCVEARGARCAGMCVNAPLEGTTVSYPNRDGHVWNLGSRGTDAQA